MTSNKNKREKPDKELLKFTPKELYAAANWINREAGVEPVMTILTMHKKLANIKGHINTNIDIEHLSGDITFEFNGKKAKRPFYNYKELAFALSYGPLNLMDTDSLYLKHPTGILNVSTTGIITDGRIEIYVPKLDKEIYLRTQYIEHKMCNLTNGLTAGQKIIQINKQLVINQLLIAD